MSEVEGQPDNREGVDMIPLNGISDDDEVSGQDTVDGTVQLVIEALSRPPTGVVRLGSIVDALGHEAAREVLEPLEEAARENVIALRRAGYPLASRYGRR